MVFNCGMKITAEMPTEKDTSLDVLFSDFNKSQKTAEEIERLSREIESKVSELSEEDFFKFTDSLSDGDLISLRHNLDDQAVRAILDRGFSFSEIHMGKKFGVDDFIDIDGTKLVRLSSAVLLRGEFGQEDGKESINDRAFRQTLALAPKHKGVADKFIEQLGQNHTIRPDIFVGEMAKACANPEIDEYQKNALISSFEYIYSSGSNQYDEALTKGLVFNDPAKYTQTGYFLNLLSSAHGLSKYGPDFSKGVSNRIEENLSRALEGSDGSYFLRTRARQVLANIERESYEKPNDFAQFSISPGQQGVFNEHGLALIDALGKEKRLSGSDLTLSSQTLSGLDIADFEFLERPYMRDVFEKEFGISLSEMHLPEQFQFLTFLKSKTESEVERVKEFTKKFGTAGMRTFLSLEQGRDFGEKILEIGEKLSPEDARKLFDKYAEIVDEAERIPNEISKAAKDNYNVDEKTIDQIKNNLLRYGRKLLEQFANTLGTEKKVDADNLIERLSQIKSDIVLSAVVFKALANEGVSIEEISNMSIETLERDAIKEGDKVEMKRIFHENRDEYPEDLREVTESEFQKILDTEQREFHILRRGQDIIAFARFDELPNGNLYIGSLNVRPEIKALTVGGTFLTDLIKQKNAEHTLEAEAYSKNRMLPNYTSKYGFKIVGDIPNYKGFAHLFHKMEIPKGSFVESK